MRIQSPTRTNALVFVSFIHHPTLLCFLSAPRAGCALLLSPCNVASPLILPKIKEYILHYLRGTSKYTLTYEGSQNTGFLAYSDSDWGTDPNNRKSHTGYLIKLANAPVSWVSHQQKTVALSSTEAEYMALSFAVKQGLWMRYFLNDVGVDTSGEATTLRVDNKGAIDLSKEPRFHSRTKHIPIHYHFTRELVADGTFTITHCSTHDMIADGLTKPLPRAGHENLVSGLGLE